MEVEEKVSRKGGLRGGLSGTTSWTLVCLRAGLCHSEKDIQHQPEEQMCKECVDLKSDVESNNVQMKVLRCLYHLCSFIKMSSEVSVSPKSCSDAEYLLNR